MRSFQLLNLGFLLCLTFPLFAQETVPASGGEAKGSGGSVSYTVGQIFYTNNGSVSQGVQQPYEIYVVNELDEAKNITLSCFPNPTADFLTLKIEKIEFPTLFYSIYDINGKLLESKTVESNETIINMSHLAAATYFLKVTDQKKELKTFRITKI